MFRVGIIGCGGIAAGHAEGYEAQQGVCVTALADIDRSRAEALRQKLSRPPAATLYQDYRELLQQERLDAVSVCTPHALHFEQTLAALERGLHVLAEKPLTTDPEQDVALIRAARAQERKLAVRYQRHSLAPCRAARELIAQGCLGRLEVLIGRLGQSWYRNQLARIERDGGSWRIDPSKSGGGQIVDSGSHLIDALFWVSGHKPAEVFAHTITKDFQVDVCSALVVKTELGALATISINGDTPAGVGYFDMEFGGDEGYLHVTDEQVQFARQGEELRPVELPPSSESVADFVAAAREGAPVAASAQDALVADVVARAALKSAETGRPEPCTVPDL